MWGTSIRAPGSAGVTRHRQTLLSSRTLPGHEFQFVACVRGRRDLVEPPRLGVVALAARLAGGAGPRLDRRTPSPGAATTRSRPGLESYWLRAPLATHALVPKSELAVDHCQGRVCLAQP